MLANEPDKCILYLYHSHKIAHWQAVFLMAPLEPLTLFELLCVFGSKQSALLVLGAWWKKQAGGACEHGIPPHRQALKWHRAARLPYRTTSHPWWLTARATRPLQVPSPQLGAAIKVPASSHTADDRLLPTSPPCQPFSFRAVDGERPRREFVPQIPSTGVLHPSDTREGQSYKHIECDFWVHTATIPIPAWCVPWGAGEPVGPEGRGTQRARPLLIICKLTRQDFSLPLRSANYFENNCGECNAASGSEPEVTLL